MRLIITAFTFAALLFTTPHISRTDDSNSNSGYINNKLFIKTKKVLGISEATGKISLQTGMTSIDEKLSRNKIVSIENVFRLRNGNRLLQEKLGMERIYILKIQSGENPDMEKIVREFDDDDNVEYSEPVYAGRAAGEKQIELKKVFNSEIPNDVMFSRQWYLRNSGSVEPSSSGSQAKVGADIKMINAWGIDKGSDDVIVAILDSGIKDDHPDLYERIWLNKKEIPGNGIDDDDNGYVDDYKGWDFAYDDRRPEDGFGHGTNIATVIGAGTNNKIGFAGIDTRCRLMNCKNLNSDNSGEYGWWAESIRYAVDNGADIINMSEGGDDYSKVLKTAVDYALQSGVLITAAMMNKGDNRDYYPASYNGVFAIGATDTDDRRCRKFSWGGGSCYNRYIGVVAPGNKIYGLDYEDNDNYDVYWSGTSQSTAIVSGIASLLLSQNRSRSGEDIIRIIKYTSKDQVGDPREDTPGWDMFYGAGRVDCYAALTYESAGIKEETGFTVDDTIKKDKTDDTILDNPLNNDRVPDDSADPDRGKGEKGQPSKGNKSSPDKAK